MWLLEPPAFCTNPKLVAVLTVSLLAVGSSIATLELLANRRQFAHDGLLSFDVLGSRPLLVGRSPSARLLRALLGYRAYCAGLLLRVLSLGLLPFLLETECRRLAIASLLVIVLSSMLIHVRSPFGLDGSDQMTTQIYGALLLSLLIGGAACLRIGLFYIAAQAALAYFASGAAKVVSPIWREGGVTYRVFNTRTYGFEPMARFLDAQPVVARVLDWSAVGAEVLFPLCLVSGFPLVFVFIVWGVVFHAVNAAVMGLNSFLWAFVATYPSLLFAAAAIQTHLWRG